MEKKKSLLIYNILISFLFQSFLSIDEPIITPEEPYNKIFNNISSEQYLTIKIMNISNTPLPNEDNIYYLHFSTDPITSQSQDLQQIIFSEEKDKPSTKDSDSYSFRFSRNANLIGLISNETNQIYLTIKCFKYPCSFNFNGKIEVNKINLYLDETHNFYSYNSNSFGKEKFNKVKFNIPTINKEGNNKLMIAIINPSDTDGDYVKLETHSEVIFPSNKKYKIKMGVVFVIDEDKEYKFYELEIESLKNQFITISIKTCISGLSYYESEITPNTVTKFSDLRFEGKKVNECFRINENYIQNFVDENSLLFASIDFFSLPIKAYLKYSDSEKPIENNDSKNSLNVILKKESNEYPLICFEQNNLNLEDNTYMLEISHMYPGMENIDIFSPIYSGFFITKTLLKNSLGFYTHYSDVYLLKKISFYLKPLKGKPEMYFVQCDNYPNCYNKITDLQNNPTKAFKAINYGNFQFYTKKYDALTKDLSPSGPIQNLLYVYCPSEPEDYCQYQILIYSDEDEIVLNNKEDFYVVAEKDEELMFKLSLKKGEEAPNKIGFCFNVTTDDIYFDKLKDFNNATVSLVKDENGMNCYRYEPDKRFNDLSQKDLDIVFNIRALKDVNFVLKNNYIYLKTNEIGEIIDLSSFSFPYCTNFLIHNSNSDLIFNLYLNDKDYQGLNLTKVEIGYTIINFTYASETQKQEIKILEGSIIETLDKATRSCAIRINKEYIKEIVKDNNEIQYYLHLVIINKDSTSTNNNKNINAKMFLLEERMNNKIFIDKNMFISDKLTLENNNIFNLYHINMENKEYLEIKFSSNYPLDDKFLIYLLEYTNENIDINYIEQNKKSYTISSIGEIYTLLFNDKNQGTVKPDILLAIVSKLDKNNITLQTINYIFKCNIFTNDYEFNKRAIYEFNENYNLTKENDKYFIEFNSIKKNNKAVKNNEIYIRQVLSNKKILEESLTTFAKIESENELIKIEKKEEKEDKTILTIFTMEKENSIFSIIIDNLKENEKFIISNKTEITPSEPEKPTDGGSDNTDRGKSNDDINDGDDSLVLKIVIPIVVVVVLIAAILIIITFKKRRGRELNINIMKTSFQKREKNLLEERYVNSDKY